MIFFIQCFTLHSVLFDFIRNTYTTPLPKSYTQTAMANIAQGIPWDQLIEFANNKKAEEKTTGKPAQLSKQQLAAVSMLVEFVKDIEVEDTYVSKLFGK